MINQKIAQAAKEFWIDESLKEINESVDAYYSEVEEGLTHVIDISALHASQLELEKMREALHEQDIEIISLKNNMEILRESFDSVSAKLEHTCNSTLPCKACEQLQQGRQ